MKLKISDMKLSSLLKNIKSRLFSFCHLLREKYIFLYRYALMNLLAYISMKRKKFDIAFDHYQNILFMIDREYPKNHDVDAERKNLLEDMHIIKYNMGNSLLVIVIKKSIIIRNLGNMNTLLSFSKKQFN